MQAPVQCLLCLGQDASCSWRIKLVESFHAFDRLNKEGNVCTAPKMRFVPTDMKWPPQRACSSKKLPLHSSCDMAGAY